MKLDKPGSYTLAVKPQGRAEMESHRPEIRRASPRQERIEFRSPSHESGETNEKTIVALCFVMALARTAQAQVHVENEFLKLESEQGVFRLTDKASGKVVIAEGQLADAQNTEVNGPRGTAVRPDHAHASQSRRGADGVEPGAAVLGDGRGAGRTHDHRHRRTATARDEYRQLCVARHRRSANPQRRRRRMAHARPRQRRGVLARDERHGAASRRRSTTGGCASSRGPARRPRRSRSATSTTRGWASKPTPTPSRSVYAIKLPPQPAGFCTWYMEKHGGACDEKHLARAVAPSPRRNSSRSASISSRSTTGGRTAIRERSAKQLHHARRRARIPAA